MNESKHDSNMMTPTVGAAGMPGATNFITENSKLSGMRVLLVDECLITREIIVDQLVREGMRVDTFASCAEALAALKAAAPDDGYRIALFDAQTSDCTPFSLGATVKSDLAYSDTFLMLLNSELSEPELSSLASAGFSAALKKPSSPQVLINALNVLCTAIASGEPPPFFSESQSTKMQAQAVDISLQLNSFSILVVDDDVVNQAVVGQMLEKFGYRVENASDGAQAVTMHGNGHFHLILMDCQMPVVDGYQATAQIRAHEAALGTGGRVPIVALTAHVLEEDREKCLASGMDDFISKPIRPHKLQEILDHWLHATNIAKDELKETIPDDDMDAMKELFGTDFAELAFLFQSDSLKRIAGMHVAAAESEYTELIRLVHAFNGSASSMGASHLAFLCKTFEAQLKSGVYADADVKVSAIEAGYSLVENRLRTMLNITETR